MITPLPDAVRLTKMPDGLDRLDVRTSTCEAQIYLHGAHVARWQPRDEIHPVLWMSSRSWFEPHRPIRGGVPICFPWFGPRPDRPDAPAHGIARIQPWELCGVSDDSDGSIVVSLELAANAASCAFGIGEFLLRYSVRFGSELALALTVSNVGTSSLRFEEALHTYLAVGDARRASVTGLAGVEYYDKTDALKRKRQDERAIVFTGETDRLYVDTAAAVTLDDPAFGRRLVVAKTGSASTVLWNPWIGKSAAMADFGDEEWMGMACLETVNAADNAVVLDAGASHTMTATVSVQR
jgi:glucose-6-phosphate 1-epimerase